MPSVYFTDPNGKQSTVDVTPGTSVMQAAVAKGLDGIVAECGGNAMCATCHIYVDEDWVTRLPEVKADEDALLEGTGSERRSNSRLSCQILMTPSLDGLSVTIPETQF